MSPLALGFLALQNLKMSRAEGHPYRPTRASGLGTTFTSPTKAHVVDVLMKNVKKIKPPAELLKPKKPKG